MCFKERFHQSNIAGVEPLGIGEGSSTQVACTPRRAMHTFEPSPETLECVEQDLLEGGGIAVRWFRMMKFCATFFCGGGGISQQVGLVLVLGDFGQDHLGRLRTP